MFGIKPEQIDVVLSTTLMQIQGVIFFLVILGLLYFTWRNKGFEVSKSRRVEWMWAVFGVGFATLISVFFYLEWGIDQLLMSIDMGIGMVLSFVHPINALCIFITSQFLRPWEVMVPNDFVLALPRMLGIIALASWIVHDLVRNRLQFVWGTSCTVMVLFAVWLYITTFKAPNPDYSQEVFNDGITRNLMIFFLVMNMIRKKWELDAAMLTLLFSVAGVAMMAIAYAKAHPESALDGGRLKSVSMMGNSNDLAALMVLIFPVLMLRFVKQLKNRAVFALIPIGLFAAFCLSVLFWAKSRGAIVALSVVLSELAFRRVKSRKLKLIAAPVILFVVFSSFALMNRSSDDVGESNVSRLLYWKTAVYMAVKNPLLGVGYAGYPFCFEKYAPETPTEWGLRTCHSSWFLVLGEASFIGCFLYMFLFGMALTAANRIKPVYPEVFSMLLAYMVAISFLSHSYLIYPYFVLGLVLAAERVCLPVSAGLIPHRPH